jgi:hypothetical protein
MPGTASDSEDDENFVSKDVGERLKAKAVEIAARQLPRITDPQVSSFVRLAECHLPPPRQKLKARPKNKNKKPDFKQVLN